MTPQYNLRRRVICSISPWALPIITRPYAPNPRGGGSKFEMPVYTIADRDAEAPPKMVEVYDSFQANMDELRDRNHPTNHKTPSFVGVETIITDILQHWIQCGIGAPSECGPGVWACEGDKPTAEEQMAAAIRQIGYCEFLYAQAKEFEEYKNIAGISKKHRIAAAYLGKEEFWARTAAERLTTTARCPLCTAQVPSNAFVCGTCGRTIKELPKEFAAMNQAGAGGGGQQQRANR